MEAPKPVKKLGDSWKAPAGKSKARERSKFKMPEMITHNTVAITPTHKKPESLLMIVILLYKRNTAIKQVAIATNVPAVNKNPVDREPRNGMFNFASCETKV